MDFSSFLHGKHIFAWLISNAASKQSLASSLEHFRA
jgi:hypothetical protein